MPTTLRRPSYPHGTTTNEERSAAEVGAFVAEKPARYFAYWFTNYSGSSRAQLYRGYRLGTWIGDRLADITEVGVPYVSNMGDKRQSFRALGINGVEYSGTAYLSGGDYVRMRAVKA